MRHLWLSALVGGLILLAPHGALVTPAAAPGSGPAALVGYAPDNPAEPGDAFPNGPFSGGTD
jgi:hypothetical protein